LRQAACFENLDLKATRGLDKGLIRDPKSGGWLVNFAVGLGWSWRFASGLRRAKGLGAVRAAGL